MKQPLRAVRVGLRVGRYLLPSLMALAPAAANRAEAAATAGGGTITFNAFAEVMSDSNVLGNTTDESDIVYTLRPQVVYNREAALVNTHFDAGIGFERYDDFSNLDSENWSVNGSMQIPQDRGGRLYGGINLRYFNGAESDTFLAQRADIKRLSFGLNGSYLVGGRTSVRFGTTHQTYDTAIRPDSDSTSYRAGVAWQARQGLNTFFDFTRTSTSNESTSSTVPVVDFTSNQYTVGLEGQISAVLSGTVSVGIQNVSAGNNDTGGDDEGFVTSVGLNWTLRQNTSLSLTGGKNTRVTANADAIDAITVALGINQQLGPALSASASLLWETFETRGTTGGNDDRIAANLNLEYSISQRFGCGAGFTHTDRDSENPATDFSRTTVTGFVRVSF